MPVTLPTLLRIARHACGIAHLAEDCFTLLRMTQMALNTTEQAFMTQMALNTTEQAFMSKALLTLLRMTQMALNTTEH